MLAIRPSVIINTLRMAGHVWCVVIITVSRQAEEAARAVRLSRSLQETERETGADHIRTPPENWVRFYQTCRASDRFFSIKKTH